MHLLLLHTLINQSLLKKFQYMKGASIKGNPRYGPDHAMAISVGLINEILKITLSIPHHQSELVLTILMPKTFRFGYLISICKSCK